MCNDRGVSLVIWDYVACTARIDIGIFNDIMASKGVEIDKKFINTDRNIIVCAIYWLASSEIVQFTPMINGVLQKIRIENNKCVSLGDYNMNIFNAETQRSTSEFGKACFHVNMFLWLIKPTRNFLAHNIFNWYIYCNQVTSESILPGLFYTCVSIYYLIFHIENWYVNEEKRSRIRTA